MTVEKLVKALTNAIDSGFIDRESTILSSTVNGCLEADEDQMMKNVEEHKSHGLYLLLHDPKADQDVLLYPRATTT